MKRHELTCSIHVAGLRPSVSGGTPGTACSPKTLLLVASPVERQSAAQGGAHSHALLKVSRSKTLKQLVDAMRRYSQSLNP